MNKKYIYEIEKYLTKHLTKDDIILVKDIGFINILCYHITSENDCKYPFIQFMLDKTPHNTSHIMPEEFIIPSIVVTQKTHDVELIAFQKMKQKLETLGCNVDYLKIDDCFTGVVQICGTMFLLFNVSCVSLNTFKMFPHSSSWFVLPSEIMNVGSVCNIPIHVEVTNLFFCLPQLGILHNQIRFQYPLPDAVYFGSDLRKIEMQSVIGTLKTQKYSLNTPYYYFCKTFNLAKKIAYSHCQEDEKKIGIMRCALFSDKCGFYSEENNKLSLTDEEIEVDFEGCNVIYIDYSDCNTTHEDILVLLGDDFQTLTCHEC